MAYSKYGEIQGNDATTQQTNNYFKRLNDIDVKDFIEWKEYTSKKNGKHYKLAFLSWAKAWEQVKLIYPDATYSIYESNIDGLTLNYFHDRKTAWVKCGVMIKGHEHVEMLPVMDKSSKESLPLEQITSFDVNTSIQRCLTKALARHGLGLSVYIGDDLENDDDNVKSYGYATEQKRKYQQNQNKATKQEPQETKVKYSASELTNQEIDPTDPFYVESEKKRESEKKITYNKDSIIAIVDKFPREKQGTILHWVETRHQKRLGDLTPDEYEAVYKILDKRLNENESE